MLRVVLVSVALLLAWGGEAWASESFARIEPSAISRAPEARSHARLSRLLEEGAYSRVTQRDTALPKSKWLVCDPCKRKRRWSFTLGPYAWLASVSGTAYSNGRSADFDISFDQIAELASGGFMLYAEFGYDRWFASFDGTWAVLQSDFPWLLGDVGFKVKQTILEGRIGYRLIGPAHGQRCNCRCSTCPPSFRERFACDVFVGARYWKTDITVRIGVGPIAFEGNNKDTWVDGMVGLRLGYQISPKWYVGWRTDFAGFGIRDGSETTGYSFLTAGWRFAKRWSLSLGYRAMLLDRVRGTGTDKNGARTWQQGPLIGLLFHF